VKLLEEFPELLEILFDQIMERTAISLAGGNAFVFSEVGGANAHFGVTFCGVTDKDEAWQKLQQLIAQYDSVRQANLIRSLEAYWYALYESFTTRNQSQLLFTGNIYFGLQEQTNLQPYIEGSFPGNITIHIPLVNMNFTIDPAPLITKYLITLALSNEWLWTSEDVTVPPDGKSWPDSLSTLDYHPLRDEYIRLVGQDRSLKGTAAQDWNLLSQRMRYVVPLFRSRHDDFYLVQCPPFSPEQVEQIWAGVTPDYNSLCIANCCTSK